MNRSSRLFCSLLCVVLILCSCAPQTVIAALAAFVAGKEAGEGGGNPSANNPPVVTVITPQETGGNIAINYVLRDAESDTCRVEVEYSIDGGASWDTATMGTGGDDITNLLSSPGGVSYSYVWDSVADNVATSAAEDNVCVRITPVEFDTRRGTSGQTDNFKVRNMTGSVVHGWAVIVGINDYPGTEYDLEFCVADAVDFKNRLLEDTERWSEAHTTLLLDSDATSTNIQYAIQNAVSSAGSDDGILFYYSGHGTHFDDTNGDEADGADEALYVYDGPLSDDDFGSWFSGANTGKILVILDSCFSGGMFKGEQLNSNNFRVKGIGPPRTAKGDGFAADLIKSLRSKDLNEVASIVVLTACDDDETCAETSELGHGVFTYFVLEALDSLRPDSGVITAEEVYEYAAPLATEYMSDQHAQLYDRFPGYLGFVSSPPTVEVFSDDMESGTAQWTADAPWAPITSDFHSSTTCWTDSPGGNYANNLNISLTSAEFSLAADATGATLTFWHHYNMESFWDYGYVEISTDGGNSWSNLESFTGLQEGWTRKVIDLTSYLGNPSVRIRFRLYADHIITRDGWYIDDVSVITLLPTPPTPPSELFAIEVSSSQVDLSWKDNSDDETGFKIERKTEISGTYAEIATVGANVTAYSDTTVSPSTHYYYRAKAYNLAGDSSHSNEAKVSKKIFFDDMESGTAQWIADAPWDQITSDFHSSTTCWTDSPSGDYSNDSDTSLTSIQFSLATGTSATLTFWHHYELESGCDYGYIEISTDGGTLWTGLTSFTGIMDNWTQKIIGLTPYLGNTSVRIRFRLTTDYSLTCDGWYIDDVSVVGCDY